MARRGQNQASVSLAPSKELTKRMKLDLFNIFVPAMQNAVANISLFPAFLPSIKQVVKIFEEDASD